MGEFLWRSHAFQENKKESSEGSGRLIVTRSKSSYPSPPHPSGDNKDRFHMSRNEKSSVRPSGSASEALTMSCRDSTLSS